MSAIQNVVASSELDEALREFAVAVARYGRDAAELSVVDANSVIGPASARSRIITPAIKLYFADAE